MHDFVQGQVQIKTEKLMDEITKKVQLVKEDILFNTLQSLTHTFIPWFWYLFMQVLFRTLTLVKNDQECTPPTLNEHCWGS